MAHIEFKVELRGWEEARTVAGPIRYAVFLESENPPAGIELDDLDAQCLHAIAFDEKGTGVGTGRLHPDGRIGRLTVAKDWRRRGVGDVLLKALIEEAKKKGHATVTVEVSLQASEFYREHGFVAEGKVYKDGNALLQKMRRPLA